MDNELRIIEPEGEATRTRNAAVKIILAMVDRFAPSFDGRAELAAGLLEDARTSDDPESTRLATLVAAAPLLQ
jgi:hypothetical protein